MENMGHAVVDVLNKELFQLWIVIKWILVHINWKISWRKSEIFLCFKISFWYLKDFEFILYDEEI